MSGFWSISGAVSSALCTAVGAIGNGMTIALFVKFEKFRNPLGYFILSLAVTDFLSSLTTTVGNTFYFAEDFNWKIDYLWCILYRLVTFGNFTASAMIIFFISVNRCIKICYTVECYKRIYTIKNIVAMLIAAFAVLNIFPIINIGGKIEHDDKKGICKLKLNIENWILLTLHFLMLCLTVLCYAKIYITYAKVQDALNHQRKQEPKQYGLLKMLSVTTVTFAVCFLVPLFFGEISKYVGDRPTLPVERFMYKVVSSVTIIINPIIYVLLNQQYRAAYFLLWRKDSQKEEHMSRVHSFSSRTLTLAHNPQMLDN